MAEAPGPFRSAIADQQHVGDVPSLSLVLNPAARYVSAALPAESGSRVSLLTDRRISHVTVVWIEDRCALAAPLGKWSLGPG
jgi:hypothetical protein